MFIQNKLSLKNWKLVKITGIDRFTFLQGQLTNDINHLQTEQMQISAHCNPKGKLIASLILFNVEQEEAIYYLVRSSLHEKQIQALKKYAIFSKVIIESVLDATIDGISDPKIIENEFQNGTRFNLKDSLFLLKLNSTCAFMIQLNPAPTLSGKSLNQDDLFEATLLEAGFPIIDLPLSEQYLPQAFNLEAWQAINYKKGCYCGQEMIARAHYRGANKRALYLFSLDLDVIHLADLPAIGSGLIQKIEREHESDYRETGTICALVKDEKNKRLLVQVILASDFDLMQKLQLTQNTMKLQPLNFNQ